MQIATGSKPNSIPNATPQRCFDAYCADVGYSIPSNFALDPLELPPVGSPRHGRLLHLAQWIHSTRGIGASSISNYISSIRKIIAVRTSYLLVRSPLLEQFLKRLRQSSPPGRKTLPANKRLLQLVCADPLIDPAVKVGVLLAFNGLLRVSEYCSHTIRPAATPLRRMQRDDVRVAPAGSYFSARIFGKSDMFNHGPEMQFPEKPGDSHCVVARLRTYLTWRDARYSPSQPLLIRSSGLFVVRKDIDAALKKHSLDAGLRPSQVSTHSLRYGGAFELVDNGASWEEVIARGRWRSDDAKRLAMQYSNFSKKRNIDVSERLRIDHHPSAELYTPLF